MLTTIVSKKRSVTFMNKRTSVSLEDAFWRSLQAIVRMQNTTMKEFIEKIESQRGTPNLSSSLRVAVLEYFQNLAANTIAARGNTEQMMHFSMIGSAKDEATRRNSPTGA